jgi:carbonic anhydrase
MTVSIRASLLLSALAMAALTAAFVDPPEESHASPAPAQPVRWSYEGEGGPQHWASLSADNQPCSAGAQQSPIDLAGALPASIAGPVVQWTPASGAMVANTGHTIQVDMPGGGRVAVDGNDYVLQNFDFHHPSEHTIDGKRFPLEAQFVHASADGDFTIVSVLFLEGAHNPNLDAIWATAPGRQAKAAVAFQVDANAFMPAQAAAFRYEGSLTTPPCSESVHWMVMATPVTASASQIAAFGALFPNNARPVQPLNRRYVLKTAG